MFLLPGNAVNRAAPLNRGLVGWWMNLPNRLGGGGSAFRDLLGRYHGTISGALWDGRKVPGGFGCLRLDGADDYVGFTPFALPTTAGTISLKWCPLETVTGSEHPIFEAQLGSPVRVFQIIPHLSSLLIAGWYNNGDDDRIITANPSYTTGQWYRFTVSWTNGGATNAYLDNTSIGSTATLTATWDTSTATTMRFGWDDSPSYGNFLLDDIRIYDRVVSPAVIDLASRGGYRNELNWQSRPVWASQAVGGTFNPAWSSNQRPYIIGGGLA